MTKTITIGVLAFQGDVFEHVQATKEAAKKIGMNCEVIEVRTKDEVLLVNALIIPGGESTVLHKLCFREGMFEEMKKIPALFGTCAGAILLAKTINHKEKEQKTLELMDIEIDRNAYGRQNESFEKEVETNVGKISAVFIRAPKIKSVGEGVVVLTKDGNEILLCEQRKNGNYYLASCFHPELKSTKMHEYFLKQISEGKFV